MSTIELKSVIHRRVDELNDEKILSFVNELLEEEWSKSSEPILSTEQMRRLELSRQQSGQGSVFSDDEANQIINVWLQK